MNCAEFKEQVSALALGALEPDEETACSEHLEAEPFHQGCHEAYARALVTAGKLATSLTPMKPGPDVWAGIEARLGTETGSGRAPRRWGATVGWAVAAAAAIALVFLWLDRQKGQSDLLMARGQVAAQTELANTAQQHERVCEDQKAAVQKKLDAASGGDRRAEAVALASEPDTKKFDMEGKGFHATLFYNARKNRAYVVSKDLDTPATAKNDFQLWVIRKSGAKGPLPAGLMRRDEETGEVDPGVLKGGEVAAIAMSLEPRGGSLNGKPTTVLMAAPVGS